MRVNLTIGKKKQYFSNVESAVISARSQARVREVLIQINSILDTPIRPVYWVLKTRVTKSENNRYAIEARGENREWYDTKWHATPNRALVELCKKSKLITTEE